MFTCTYSFHEMKFPLRLCAYPCLALLASLASAWADTNDPESVYQWKRTPELVVPFVSEAPKIDGRVTPEEWAKSAELGPFKAGLSGLTEPIRRRAWISYDDKNIYLAFSFERPPGSRSPMLPEVTGRYEKQVNGPIDAIEALFAPKLQFNDSRSFWMYANGAYADAECVPFKKTGWNAEWLKGARETDSGWEGEMAIPFAAFGLDGPPPSDERWGFDVLDNRATPTRHLAHWSYRGDVWHAFENFGRIRFAKVPAVRFLNAGELKDQKYEVALEIYNPATEVRTFDVSVDLKRRKAGEEGGPKSYLENIQSGNSQDVQQEFTKGVNLDQVIEGAETFYEPAPELSREESGLKVPAGETGKVVVTGPIPYGEYLVTYQVKEENGEALARGTVLFRSDPPLALKAEPYWLYSEVIDVTADLGKTKLDGKGEFVLRLLPVEGEKAKPLREARIAADGTQRDVKGALDIKGLPSGAYLIEAVLLDAQGKELARNEQAISRPDFPVWFKNDIGNKIEVPKPWTPVKASQDGVVQVWGRTYDLRAVFPGSVLSNGVEILSGGVQLRTATQQGPVSWKVEKVALKTSTLGKAVYDIAMSGGGLRLQGTMTIEFDGLVWYDLKLSASDQPVEVASMTLDIPLAAQFAELMSRHRFLVDPVFSTSAPKPLLNGMPGRLEEAQMPFTPYLWIGNEQAGMGLIAEAPINWRVASYRSLLETKPATKGEPARILANIMQKPGEIGKPISLQFGLQATPIRPPTLDRSLLNISQRQGVTDNEQYFADIAKMGGKVVVFYHDWTGSPKTQFGGTPERPPTPELRAKLKRAVERAHKHGLKVILFTGWGVNASSENWKKFSYELASYPFTNIGHGAYASSAGANGAYADFMAWGHADLAREYGVDGVLWDSAANIGDVTHPRIGEAWLDDEGRVRPKFPVLATRDLYRRIYNIYNGEVRDSGVIYNHTGSLWPVNVFADMQNRGEGRPMRALTLKESWVPFEEFRAEYAGDPFGTFHSGEVNDGARLPMTTTIHAAVTLLHGSYAKTFEKPHSIPSPLPKTYDVRNSLQRVYWQAFNWLPMDGTEKSFFYYKNAKGRYQAVQAEPASLLSSAFASGDGRRALVVVSNLENEPVSGARVFLDPAAIGLPADKPLKVEDAVARETLKVEEGILTVDIEAQRFRLLRVSVE